MEADNCRRLLVGDDGMGPKLGGVEVAAANWAKLIESMIMAVEF